MRFYNPASIIGFNVADSQMHSPYRRNELYLHPGNKIIRRNATLLRHDGHVKRVVRAYQDFKDETSFTRVVPIEEIRAKEGNLSIPLYVGGETQARTDAAAGTATTALPEALMAWIKTSSDVHKSLTELLNTTT